jgi:hypothetical protein
MTSLLAAILLVCIDHYQTIQTGARSGGVRLVHLEQVLGNRRSGDGVTCRSLVS